MKKNVLMMLMALVLVIAMAGCSSAKSETGGNSATAANSASPANSAGGASPAAGAKTIKLALVVMTLTNPWNVSVKNGFETACKELKVSCLTIDSQYKVDKQVSDVESVINDNYTGIILEPIDQNAMKDLTEQAKAKGIVVSSIAQPQSNANLIYTLDEKKYGYTIGENAANWIKNNLNGKAKVAIISQDNVEAVIPRGNGVEEAIKTIAPNAQIVTRQAGDSPELGMKIIESVLQQHPDLDVVVATNDSGGIGGYQAMVNGGAIGAKKAVFSGDATAEALAKMKEKDSIYRGTVDLFPYKGGYESAKLLYKYITEGVPKDQQTVMLDMVPVSQEDLLSGKYKPQG